MFSREILVDGRGIGLNIFKCNFCHAHVVYQLKNELQSTLYFTSRLLKQLFYLMPYLLGFFDINVVKGQCDFRKAFFNILMDYFVLLTICQLL